VGSPLFTAPEIIRYKGHAKASDYWSWAVVVYKMVTGKYPFYTKGMDELKLYKRICKGTFELDGLVSMEFRMLMVSILYPDPSKRLGSHANGWKDIFGSPWLANEYDASELRSLHTQELPAPWIPDLQDRIDASRFHPDASEVDDLVDECFPSISEKEQTIFNSFGPQI
jgi:serine/threonine protein kinase